MKLAWLAAAAFAVATPAFAGQTTFSDSKMLLSDYAITTYSPSSNFTTEVLQTPGQGDDSGFGTIYIATGSTTPSPRIQALGKNFVYDPSALGAITAIDASLDQIVLLLYNSSEVDVSATKLIVRLLAEQDGQVYRTRTESDVFAAANDWRSTSVTGITSADFLRVDPNDPFTAATGTGLDFAGGAIRFGFEISPFGVLVNGGPSTGLTVSYHFVDNLKITLNTQDPGGPVGGVPEPSTWAMMILGFSLAGSVVRRRRMALV